MGSRTRNGDLGFDDIVLIMLVIVVVSVIVMSGLIIIILRIIFLRDVVSLSARFRRVSSVLRVTRPNLRCLIAKLVTTMSFVV